MKFKSFALLFYVLVIQITTLFVFSQLFLQTTVILNEYNYNQCFILKVCQGWANKFQGVGGGGMGANDPPTLNESLTKHKLYSCSFVLGGETIPTKFLISILSF